MAVLERVPHHEEREEQKQFQHLETGEFTVMPFLNSNAGEIEVQAGDCTDYTINGPVTIILEGFWSIMPTCTIRTDSYVSTGLRKGKEAPSQKQCTMSTTVSMILKLIGSTLT